MSNYLIFNTDYTDSVSFNIVEKLVPNYQGINHLRLSQCKIKLEVLKKTLCCIRKSLQIANQN